MKEENVKEWLRLSESGQVAEAEDFYYNTLFVDVIDEFCDRNSLPEIRCNVLFSVLGYSPEPIILTQRALNPEVHIIFTTDIDNAEASKKIREYLGKYLTSEFKIIEVEDTSFNGIYSAMKDQMMLHPSQDYVIDITGGKKSMVASAAIFGRDYNCNIVYVDYDQYISQIRKPLPGSERLNYVYRPALDLPEIKFFAQQPKPVVETKAAPTPKARKKEEPVPIAEPVQVLQRDFFEAFTYLVRENKASWLTKDVELTIVSRRAIILSHLASGRHIEIQRGDLFLFFCKCKEGKLSHEYYLQDKGAGIKLINAAVSRLLIEINSKLYERK
jgi:CRISPR/Cas system-associated exonuclease Cas4 (RecB family)